MNPLRRLAELAGILPEYHDIWGTRHVTSDATRQALLTAMDIACGSEAEIAASLRAWQEREWMRHLAPVQVESADTPLRITLRLPAAAEGQTFLWHLFLEDGGSRAGRLVANDLELLDSGEVAGQAWHARALELPALAETVITGNAASTPSVNAFVGALLCRAVSTNFATRSFSNERPRESRWRTTSSERLKPSATSNTDWF